MIQQVSVLRMGNLVTKKDKRVPHVMDANAWYSSRNNLWDARLRVTAIFMFGSRDTPKSLRKTFDGMQDVKDVRHSCLIIFKGNNTHAPLPTAQA